jgi:membrane protein
MHAVRTLVGKGIETGRATFAGYGRHAGSSLAAGLAYRVLFSLVPLLALVVSLLDIFLPKNARTSIVHWLFNGVPGTAFESAVDNSAAHTGTAPLVTLIAVVILLWAATGMMGAIRTAFRVIWEQPGAKYVRGKLRDFLLVALTALLILAAFGASLAAQIVAQAGKGVSDWIGWHGGGTIFGTLVELCAGLAVAFLAFTVLYTVVPPVRERFGAVWPSALLAAVAVEVLIRGFAFYATNFTSYNKIYGSLGILFVFLFLVYLLAMILLLGAELIVARR